MRAAHGVAGSHIPGSPVVCVHSTHASMIVRASIQHMMWLSIR